MSGWKWALGVGVGVAGATAAAAAGGLAAQRTMAARRARRGEQHHFGTLRAEPHTVVADDGIALHVEVDELDQPDPALPTVVFVHGYVLDLDCWHFQRAALRGRYRMVFYDQRSHGRSGRSSSAHSTIDQLGRDLAAVLDQEVAERADRAGRPLDGRHVADVVRRAVSRDGRRAGGGRRLPRHQRRRRRQAAPGRTGPGARPGAAAAGGCPRPAAVAGGDRSPHHGVRAHQAAGLRRRGAGLLCRVRRRDDQQDALGRHLGLLPELPPPRARGRAGGVRGRAEPGDRRQARPRAALRPYRADRRAAAEVAAARVRGRRTHGDARAAGRGDRGARAAGRRGGRGGPAPARPTARRRARRRAAR